MSVMGCVICRRNDEAYHDGLTRISVTVREVFDSQHPPCGEHWLLFRDYVRSAWADKSKRN